MKKLLTVCAGLVTALCIAGPASAQAVSPAMGTLELCKATVPAATPNLAVSGPFTFTITSGTGAGTTTTTRTVSVGQCSNAIPVVAGAVTVTETVPVWAEVVSVVQTRPTGPTTLTRTGASSSTVTVNVAPGGAESESLITYTNRLVTGTIEVCKEAAPGSGLSGNFNFTLTNVAAAGPPSASPLASTTVAVPVGGCSNPITIAAGDIRVVETDAGGAAAIAASPAGALVSSDPETATAVVRVAPGTTSTNGPIVTFTNNSALLKVCKVAGDGVTVGTPFSFTATPAGAGGPAQPFPVTAGPAATGGNCVTVGTYRQGTTVAIQEAVNPGTMVPTGGIAVTPAGRVVAGTTNEGARSISVVVSTGTTIVTYTNVAAPPGTLKICKVAGTGVAAGSGPYTFTVSGVVAPVTVMAGSCAIVGGPVNPVTFPFRSTQTITETTPPAGQGVSAITVLPADRVVGTPNALGRSVQVTIGSTVLNAAAGETVVSFTNTVGAPTTTSDTTIIPGGSSTSVVTSIGGVTSAPSAQTQPSASVVANSIKAASNAKSVAKTRLVLAQVRTVGGKVKHHVLTARVTSSHRTVKIAVAMFGAHGKRLGTQFLTIAANRQVKTNLHWNAKITKVQVRLVNAA